MSQSTLSRELALAIGLAARALPKVEVQQLIVVLIDCVGVPLTETKFRELRLQQYKKALNRNLKTAFSSAQVQASFEHLNIQDKCKSSPSSPVLQAYKNGDMPHSIRVAVASKQGVYVDGQFSQCPQFYIFQVSALEARLIMIRAANSTEPQSAVQKQHYRAELIQDCKVLYSHSIGGQAAAKAIKLGVHPIKLTHTALVSEIIQQLQHVLSTSPPPWLAKTMGLSQPPIQPSLFGETL